MQAYIRTQGTSKWCSAHPYYAAKLPPKCDCIQCARLWEEKRLDKSTARFGKPKKK